MRVLQGLHGQGPGLVQVPGKKSQSRADEVLQQNKEHRERGRPNGQVREHERQAGQKTRSQQRAGWRRGWMEPSPESWARKLPSVGPDRPGLLPCQLPGEGTLYSGHKVGLSPRRHETMSSSPSPVEHWFRVTSSRHNVIFPEPRGALVQGHPFPTHCRPCALPSDFQAPLPWQRHQDRLGVPRAEHGLRGSRTSRHGLQSHTALGTVSQATREPLALGRYSADSGMTLTHRDTSGRWHLP